MAALAPCSSFVCSLLSFDLYPLEGGSRQALASIGSGRWQALPIRQCLSHVPLSDVFGAKEGDVPIFFCRKPARRTKDPWELSSVPYGGRARVSGVGEHARDPGVSEDLDVGDAFAHLMLIIIIINPLTARVVGASQMILQSVFSIFPCSPLPSGTCRTPGLSIP